jgi:hypothetical protein
VVLSQRRRKDSDMAYLHCHNCAFSQDDFWSWGGYNPISFFIRNELTYYLKPRRIDYGEEWAKEEVWKRCDPHSWFLLWNNFKSKLMRFFYQKWWTYKSWERAVERNNGKWPACPKCGKHKLDID